MRFQRLGLTAVGSIIGVAAIAEYAARTFVDRIVGTQQLQQIDSTVGWRTKPNINATRTNAMGDTWHITTDAQGFRHQPPPASPRKTLLIVGDSFAFGEGVNLADRFDATIARAHPDVRILNTGVRGFGLDQAYFASQPILRSLKAGDVVLALVFENDLTDVLVPRRLWRPRPQMLQTATGWRIEPPQVTPTDRLADWSYVATFLLRQYADPGPAAPDYRRALSILSEALRLVRKDVPPGVKLALAHVGRGSEPGVPKDIAISVLCPLANLCVDLDDPTTRRALLFMPDGHWSKAGHTQAGARIGEAMKGLLAR